MTDRERLEQMAAENRQKKDADKESLAKQRAEEVRVTEEIAIWGKTLLPFNLETGHELNVDSAEGHRFGYQGNWADALVVCFWVDHNGWDQRGQIPLCSARYTNGAFELRKLDAGAKVFNQFDPLKAEITKYLAEVDREFMVRAIPRFCREVQWTRIR